MKITIAKLFFIVTLLTYTSVIVAQKKEEQIITAVEFTKEDIVLNNKIAFKYSKEGNRFEIFDLNNKSLIVGNIKSIGNGKFSSIIVFQTLGQQFSNSRIIGRNDLIFALCENNVFTKDLDINEDKLKEFIKRYNELDISTIQIQDSKP